MTERARFMARQPGFISISLHRSLDGRRIVNYIQWQSRDLLRSAHKSPEFRKEWGQFDELADEDFIPLGELPEGVPVATNGGGYAKSMAEPRSRWHLPPPSADLEHENIKLGQFNQFTRNRMLAGGLCGIFGFGGIGAATGRLMYSIGMRVHAINRHGRTDERVDWIGTPERLDEFLEAADVLLISAPLTPCHLRPDRRRRASPHEGRCHSRQPGPWGDRAGKAIV